MFRSHPKKGRDREAHLNYYASAYNRGDNYRITRLKAEERNKPQGKNIMAATLSTWQQALVIIGMFPSQLTARLVFCNE